MTQSFRVYMLKNKIHIKVTKSPTKDRLKCPFIQLLVQTVAYTPGNDFTERKRGRKSPNPNNHR